MLRTALLFASAVTVAATVSSQASPGFRVYGPHGTNDTFMVDNTGTIVHTWPGDYVPGNGLYLLADGSLLRSGREPGAPSIGGSGGNVQRRAFDGTLLWDYKYADANHWQHHDIEPMPNGNVLLVAWDLLTDADAIQAGRDPALLTGTPWFPDTIIEVEPDGLTGGNIVWEWRFMDHLIQDHDPTKDNFGVVADHPELVDINYPPTPISNGDWNHVNAVSYSPVEDLILVNSPFMDQLFLIDHSTTTLEAAGHTGGARGIGGDILYRWGNPASYGAGSAADQTLYFPHGSAFIPEGLPGAGNILLFNNRAGLEFGMDFSSIVEFELPPTFALAPGAAWGPAAPIFEYTAPVPTDLYSSGLSNAERMPNGNTQVVSGRQNGWMFEMTPTGTIVWEYFNTIPAPSALVFQASYYERYLWADTETLSTSSGGTVDFDLVAGSDRAGDFYLLLGTLSGTTPGFDYLGNNVPLNPDSFFQLTLKLAGSGSFPGTVGNLDLLGNSSAEFVLPAAVGASLSGMTMHYAYAALDPVSLAATRVSNAVPVELLP